MAVVANCGVQALSAGSTAAVDIAHGLGTSPQLFLNLSTGPATGLVTGNHEWLIGVTDGTRHFSMSGIVQDAATTAAVACSLSATDRLGAEMETAGNTVTGYHTFTSADATNVRITPTDAYARDKHLTWLALTGADNVYVDAFTTAASSADIVRTGCGFTPEWAIVISGITGSADLTVGQRAHLSFGVYDGTNQWCCYGGTEEGGSNFSYGAMHTDAVLLFSANSTSYLDKMAFTSFGAGGGTIQRLNGAAARPMCVIWGRGSNPVAGTFALGTGAGSPTIDTTGHLSKFLLTAARPSATAGMSAPAEPCEQHIGIATSATARHSLWRLDYNAEPVGAGSPTDPLSYQNDAALYERRTRTGTDTTTQAALVDIASIAQNSITLDQTVGDVATLVGYLSLGDAPATAVDYRPMIRAGALRRLKYLHSEHAMPLERHERGGVFAAPAMRLIGGSEPDLPDAPERDRHRGSRIRRNKRRRG